MFKELEELKNDIWLNAVSKLKDSGEFFVWYVWCNDVVFNIIINFYAKNADKLWISARGYSWWNKNTEY